MNDEYLKGEAIHMLAMTQDKLEIFLEKEFPQIAPDIRIHHLDESGITVDMLAASRHLRPGNTVSGPTLFTLADVAFYLLILSRIGPEALTVTTGAHINFMRKPEPGTLRAYSRILKLGRSLVVGDVEICSPDDTARARPFAHASLTYSIPPGSSQPSSGKNVS